MQVCVWDVTAVCVCVFVWDVTVVYVCVLLHACECVGILCSFVVPVKVRAGGWVSSIIVLCLEPEAHTFV